MKNNKTLLIIGLILITALSRLLPHPANFAPLAGMALFGGYYFEKKWHSFAITAGSWWLTDLVLNNIVYKQWFPTFTWISPSFITVAISLMVIILISKLVIKKINFLSIIQASILSSVAFFVITNFGTFLELYPKNMTGLVAAYTAAIPFFKNTLVGDLVYSGLLFGIYHYVVSAKNAMVYIKK
jgi:hypothetical protein